MKTEEESLEATLDRVCYRLEKVARNPRGDSGPKCEIELHTPPESVPQEHLACLLTALAFAFTASKAVSDAKYPIHIHVTIDGVTACGAVQPVGHGEPSKCSGEPS
jgi:hypothetical protein